MGVAYEIPEKALRIALTYGSAIDFRLELDRDLPGRGRRPARQGHHAISMPQSVNLDFQTGIAPKTLLIGSMRWTNYEGWEVRAPGLADNFDAILASKDYNIWTYKLGVGRQFTPHWAGAVQALYEPSINKTLGPLNPTDGAFGLGLGGTYTTDKGIKIGGGRRIPLARQLGHPGAVRQRQLHRQLRARHRPQRHRAVLRRGREPTTENDNRGTTADTEGVERVNMTLNRPHGAIVPQEIDADAYRLRRRALRRGGRRATATSRPSSASARA